MGKQHTLALWWQKIYSASNSHISKFTAKKIYVYDTTSLTKFAGPKLSTFKGGNDLPVAVMIVLAENLI